MSAFDDYLSAPVQTQQGPSFDSYLGSSAAPLPTSAVQPPQVSSSNAAASAQPQGQWQAPGGFVMGLGDIVKGGAQDIVHGLAWAANKIAPNSQFAQAANAALPQMQQTIDQQNALYAAQRAAQGGSGTDLLRLAGNTVGTIPTLAIGPEYAGLGLAGRMGLGAAQGAAGAAMMPTSDQNFWTNKAEQVGVGGLLGGATPLATAGAGALGRGLWGAVQPVVQPTQFVGRGLAGAMEPAEAATAASNIRGAQQFVPGSMPTAAQVAQTPVMVQTEKAAANMPAFKTAMAQRAIDNNDARWQALMGVAEDPQWQATGAAQTPVQTALQAAQTARDAAATPLYQQAHQATANVGPAFMRYAQIPEMQQAMQDAHNSAALDAAVGRGVPPVWPTPTSNTINGSALDYTSRALGDMISTAQRTGETSRAASLSALKNNVDNWTQRYIPGVQAAKAAYAQGSVPVNTMQVGQQIANGLGTRAMNAGGVPEIGLMPFRSALTSAMNSGDAAKYGIDAGALNTLQGIGQDLQRATVSNSIKSPGSDTAYNLAANGWLARQLYGPTFGGAMSLGRALAGGATALAGHPYVGLGVASGLGKIGQQVGGRLQDRLTGLLMDPNAILPYLDTRAAAPAQDVPNALVRGLMNYARPAAVTGTTGLLNSP